MNAAFGSRPLSAPARIPSIAGRGRPSRSREAMGRRLRGRRTGPARPGCPRVRAGGTAEARPGGRGRSGRVSRRTAGDRRTSCAPVHASLRLRSRSQSFASRVFIKSCKACKILGVRSTDAAEHAPGPGRNHRTVGGSGHRPTGDGGPIGPPGRTRSRSPGPPRSFDLAGRRNPRSSGIGPSRGLFRDGRIGT